MSKMPEALEIVPAPSLRGEAAIPGSKSYTNRALLVAALARGSSVLKRPLHSDDTHYMLQALRKLGIEAAENDDGSAFRLEGCGGSFPNRQAELAVGNSGTTARFLTAALCAGEGKFRLDGTERMRERPIQDLIDGLTQLGCRVVSEKANGCPPLMVEANGIRGGVCRVPGTRSSQFFSALLMAAPYAAADVTVEVVGDLVSKPYVEMTLQVMRDFGARVENHEYASFRVPAGQPYSGRDYVIEPDATNATYYWAAAAIGGGPIKVTGLSSGSAQGDVGFVEVLREMGCEVQHQEDGIEVRGGPLAGGEFDFGDMPDAALTLAVVALFAEGPTTIRNIGNLRIKETDRIAALAAEIEKLGGGATQGDDFLTVTPGRLRGASIETYDDHRMAMSFALAGARVPNVIILDPGCVAKTYPDYFTDISRIGLMSRQAER